MYLPASQPSLFACRYALSAALGVIPNKPGLPSHKIFLHWKTSCKTADSPLWTNLDADGVVSLLTDQGYTARHVVITGGEPCIYDLVPLTQSLEKAGFRCQIETSGTSEVKATTDTWVTVSPKINMKAKLDVLPSALQRADEIKHPVGTSKDIEQLDSLIDGITLKPNVSIALQPISQKPRATELCIDTCVKRNWRLSIQTHKYLAIA